MAIEIRNPIRGRFESREIDQERERLEELDRQCEACPFREIALTKSKVYTKPPKKLTRRGRKILDMIYRYGGLENIPKCENFDKHCNKKYFFEKCRTRIGCLRRCLSVHWEGF